MRESPIRMRAAGAFALILASIALVSSLLATPVRGDAGGNTIRVTLYGNAGFGWGYNATNLTNPGPTIVVHRGDVVNLTLIGTDPVDHNWFIDYDNDSRDNDGGPSSPVFKGSTPVYYEFNADREGNFTYRCVFHPITMTGLVQVRPPPSVTYDLAGNAGFGWGFNSTNVTNPGPTLVAYEGGSVTLNLSGTDVVDHNWFIDYNNNSRADADEPVSPTFRGSTVVVWSFVPDRPGNFTYRCVFHPITMTGLIEIRPTGAARPRDTGGPAVELIPGIMAGTLVLVFLFAAGYHLRAVRAQRRAK